MPPPPTPAARNQFIASVGGGRSHIHPDNDGFSHQEPECAPPPPTPPHQATRMGVWHYTKPSSGVSPACRAPNAAIPPYSPGKERLPHRRRRRLQPWQAHPTPHPRSGSTSPATASGQSVARCHGGNIGLHPLFSRNEIRPTQLTQTVTNRSSTH